jgi:hypothetical protein
MEEWDSIYNEPGISETMDDLNIPDDLLVNIGNLLGQSPERGDNGSNEHATGP